MPHRLHYEKPPDWPKTLGLTMPGLEDSGKTPDIAFSQSAGRLKFADPQERAPVHRVKVTNTGGPAGRGTVQQTFGIQELSVGKETYPVDKTAPDGSYDVYIDWDASQTAIVETREMEHVADLDRAWDLTWGAIAIGMRAVPAEPVASTSAKPNTNAVDQSRIDFRNKEFISLYGESGGRDFIIDEIGRPILFKDRPWNQPLSEDERSRAYRAGVAQVDQELNVSYDASIQEPLLMGAKLKLMHALLSRLDPHLQPRNWQQQTLGGLMGECEQVWRTRYQELSQKTRERDRGANAEHGGVYVFDRLALGKIYLKRVPNVTRPRPTSDVVRF